MQLTRLTNAPAWFRRLLGVLLLVLATAMILGPLAGCATAPQPAAKKKPACPVAKVFLMPASDGRLYYVFDQENVDTVSVLITALRDGACEPGEFWATNAGMQ